MTIPESKHNVVEDEDQLEKLMKRTGCLELHYKIQECIAEKQDWRKCQTEVHDFKKCMDEYKSRGGPKN
ncbi:predicted protein [Pediculus humanus corporis]|uniref:Predicted protein n=1 Tax=Pediculus humanus subsp. corporis TaxID=121224 RepID=E0VR98_PEDHC|nr:uncharacterized protein Phum_PHUM395720 [Pediculus humanus corporis]EEB15904.1 predicted protein [Pediculus humanus corporis]